MLHVDDSRQLLDSVEQQVALLDGFLVLPVFTVGSAMSTGRLEFCLFPSLRVQRDNYLLVSTISLTLSILQWRRPAAMNRDNSLWSQKRKIDDMLSIKPKLKG